MKNNVIGRITKITGAKILIRVTDAAAINKLSIESFVANYISIGSLVGTRLVDGRILILTVEEIYDSQSDILVSSTITGIYDEVTEIFIFGTNTYPLVGEQVFRLWNKVLEHIFAPMEKEKPSTVGTYVYDSSVKVGYNPNVISLLSRKEKILPDLHGKDEGQFILEQEKSSKIQSGINEKPLPNTISEEGVVKINSSDEEVIKCSMDDSLDIDTLIGIYWSFFQLHSKQRMKVLDLAIKVQLGLFAAYYTFGDQINKLKIMCAIAISIVGFLCYCLDKRTTDLIHNARVVFRKVEEEYLDNRPDEMKLFTSIKKNEGRITYSLIIRIAYLLLVVVGLILLVVAVKEYKTISNSNNIGAIGQSIGHILSEIV